MQAEAVINEKSGEHKKVPLMRKMLDPYGDLQAERVIDDASGDTGSINQAREKKRRWVSINAVENKGTWVSHGMGEITIDSAAEESVCPRD